MQNNGYWVQPECWPAARREGVNEGRGTEEIWIEWKEIVKQAKIQMPAVQCLWKQYGLIFIYINQTNKNENKMWDLQLFQLISSLWWLGDPLEGAHINVNYRNSNCPARSHCLQIVTVIGEIQSGAALFWLKFAKTQKIYSRHYSIIN